MNQSMQFLLYLNTKPVESKEEQPISICLHSISNFDAVFTVTKYKTSISLPTTIDPTHLLTKILQIGFEDQL